MVGARDEEIRLGERPKKRRIDGIQQDFIIGEIRDTELGKKEYTIEKNGRRCRWRQKLLFSDGRNTGWRRSEDHTFVTVYSFGRGRRPRSLNISSCGT